MALSQCGPLAHQVEQGPFKPWVLGSSPRRPMPSRPRWRARRHPERRRYQKGAARETPIQSVSPPSSRPCGGPQDSAPALSARSLRRSPHYGLATMAWYLYIAQCADGSLYTGIATNPHQRLKRHNTGRGSSYVRSKGTASLVYTEPCPDESAARRREFEVKSWNRQKKLALIGVQREVTANPLRGVPQSDV